MTHQTTDTWTITKLRNPGPGAGTDACSVLGTLGITEDGTLYRYTGITLTPWQQVFAPPLLGTTFYSVSMCESLNLAVLSSAVHYFHVTEAVNLRTIAAVVNGTTINSGASVVITIAIVGGATLGTITLPNGTAAGVGVSSTVNPVVPIPAGSVISATVTTEATVAAGSASVSLGFYLA